MTRILAVAANTFRETVRERVLYNLVFFAVLMTFSSLLMGELSIHQDEKIIKDLGLASIDIFGTLIAIFIGVGLIGKEIERRSLYPLLAKPVSRTEFLLGKFAGLSFTLIVNTGAMAAGLFAALVVAHHPADLGLLKAIYATDLALMLVVAVAILFSTLASSQFVALLCSVGVVAAGRFADVIRNMGEVTSVPRWLIDTLYFLVPNLSNFDLKDRVVYGDPVGVEALGDITLYAVAYAGVLLAASVLAFRRRDLL